MKKVKLAYFKNSGKWYTNGEYKSTFEFDFMIYKEVRAFNGSRQLPGLSSWTWDGYILVEPENGVPGLIDLKNESE